MSVQVEHQSPGSPWESGLGMNQLKSQPPNLRDLRRLGILPFFAGPVGDWYITGANHWNPGECSLWVNSLLKCSSFVVESHATIQNPYFWPDQIPHFCSAIRNYSISVPDTCSMLPTDFPHPNFSSDSPWNYPGKRLQTSQTAGATGYCTCLVVMMVDPIHIVILD